MYVQFSMLWALLTNTVVLTETIISHTQKKTRVNQVHMLNYFRASGSSLTSPPISNLSR